MYHKLTPVSDLNGDGFADALEIDSSTSRIFTGSASGYDDSDITLSTRGLTATSTSYGTHRGQAGDITT